jgi:hypothetical protein
MMTEPMAWARSSNSRHHDPYSVKNAGSGSNEPGSQALLTWTRMMTQSMAWARSSTPATMIRIQLKNAGSGSNDGSTAHLDPHDDGVDGLSQELHSGHHVLLCLAPSGLPRARMNLVWTRHIGK